MSFMDFFKPNLEVQCPYCLQILGFRPSEDVEECLNCKKPLGSMYIQKYLGGSTPFFLQVMGKKDVGKSVFLNSLTWSLRRMNILWPQLAPMSLNSETDRFFQEIEGLALTGQMPRRTPIGASDTAYIVLLNHMEKWMSRLLVIRDVAGEAFDTFEIKDEHVPYLRKVAVSLMMFSLKDLDEERQKLSVSNEASGPGLDTPDQLMTRYINKISVNRGALQNRRVVIVLTKGDRLEHRLTEGINEYLQNDPLGEAVKTQKRIEFGYNEQEAYLRDMSEASSVIKTYLEDDPDWGQSWRAISAMAETNNIELCYSIISSTGAELDPNNRIDLGQYKPKRVFDPMFWAFDFSR